MVFDIVFASALCVEYIFYTNWICHNSRNENVIVERKVQSLAKQVYQIVEVTIPHRITRMFLSRTVIRFASRAQSPLICRRNMHLLLNKALVNGQWVSGSTNEELPVLNPANGSVIGHVPNLTTDDVQNAINAAHATFHSDEWSSLTAKERSGLLKVSVRIWNRRKARSSADLIFDRIFL